GDLVDGLAAHGAGGANAHGEVALEQQVVVQTRDAQRQQRHALHAGRDRAARAAGRVRDDLLHRLRRAAGLVPDDFVREQERALRLQIVDLDARGPLLLARIARDPAEVERARVQPEAVATQVD